MRRFDLKKSRKVPNKTGLGEVDKVLLEVYDEINNIINSVNNPKTDAEITTRDGKPGDIRIIKDTSLSYSHQKGTGGNYFLEAKTDDGWVRQYMDRTEHSGISRKGTIPMEMIKWETQREIKQGKLSFWKKEGRFSPGKSNNDSFYTDNNVIIGKNSVKQLLFGNPDSTAVSLKNVDGILQVRNEDDTEDVEIKAKKFTFDNTKDTPTATKRGELYYKSSDSNVHINTRGLVLNAFDGTDTNKGDKLEIASFSYLGDNFTSLYDEGTVKWRVGYDKTSVAYTDATCDTTDGSTTVSFDNGGAVDTKGFTASPVSGSGIPAQTFIESIDKSANTLVLTNAATATASNVTLTFNEVVDEQYKIHANIAGSAVDFADTSVFNLDKNGKLELFGTAASLKLSHNALDYATLSVADTGDLTIATLGDVANVSDLIFDINGKINIEYNHADGFNIYKATNIEHVFQSSVYRQYYPASGSYFEIVTLNNRGSTVFRTQDVADSNSGHLTISPEGHASFTRAAGFLRRITNYADNAVNTGHSGNATDIDFRTGNKQILELDGNIVGTSAGGTEYLSLIFPETSGNFTLILVQDGTGNRTVHSTAWKAFDYQGNAGINTLGADGTDGEVRWAGGTAPTLTTTADKTDIVSIFWDAVTETACAAITKNF